MSSVVTIYDIQGNVSSTLDLSIPSDFVPNMSLIHEAIIMQRSNARIPIAHTKTRAEVSGSGKKLYKQKWTGSARVWDKRSPIRRKWWVAFGPRNDRNYYKSMNKKMKKHALLSALFVYIQQHNISWLNEYPYTVPKTKNIVWLLNNLSLSSVKTLFVLPFWSTHIAKSIRNIPSSSYVWDTYLNPYDIMNNRKIVFVEWAVNTLSILFNSVV